MKKVTLISTLLLLPLFQTVLYAYPPHLQSANQTIKDTQKYGPLRVKLGVKVKELLNKTNTKWFIDTGTLLGAYRSGKTIPTDDDFDMGMLGTEEELNNLFKFIQKELIATPYNARLVNTYCKKIEVYDQSYGHYILDEKTNTNFHNVTVDIQLYTAKNENINYEYYKNNMNKYVHVKVSDILPLTTIQFEGHEFNAPNNIKNYLTAHYGYIGLNAQYNAKTRMYEKKT